MWKCWCSGRGWCLLNLYSKWVLDPQYKFTKCQYFISFQTSNLCKTANFDTKADDRDTFPMHKHNASFKNNISLSIILVSCNAFSQIRMLTKSLWYFFRFKILFLIRSIQIRNHQQFQLIIYAIFVSPNQEPGTGSK